MKVIRELVKLGIGVGAGGAAGAAGAAAGAAGSAGAAAGGTAGAGTAGAAGVAGGAAAGLAKGGFWRNALRVGGIAAVGMAIKEALDAFDQEGNLWGATSGADDWFRRNLGIDPSKLNLAPSLPKPGEGGMFGVNKPFAGIQTGEKAQAKADAAAAGNEFMAGYEEAIRRGFADLNAVVDAEMQKLKSKMSTSAGITITPRVEGSALRGVHADTGVE